MVALANTFRIGCMGDVSETDNAEAMQAVADTLQEMGFDVVGRAEPAD